MKDFFISYNKHDKQWAEWIAWLLEEAGYSVVIQAWDFRPGANFVLEMQRAAGGTQQTIAVLSENYLEAEYTHPEWASAFAQDPQSLKRLLIPIRVQECIPRGLLGQLIYVDLVGLEEEDAKSAVFEALTSRAKPSEAPLFPGTRQRTSADHIPFPSPVNQTTEFSRDSQESISSSDSAKFLEALTSIRRDLDMLLKVVGLKHPDDGELISISDAWKRLFESQSDTLSKQFKNTLQAAEEVRDAIIEGKSSEGEGVNLQALSEELALASNYIDTQLRNYHREIVEKAIEATLRAYGQPENRRAGIVWQTQGSGLGLSTLSYAARAVSLKQLDNPTVIIVADRDVLTQQLYHRLRSYSDPITSTASLISDTTELIHVLGSGQQRIIFTTLQRLLRLEPEHASRRRNILLVGYNLHMSAEKVRRILPEATSILFTSVALISNSKDTVAFGDLVSKYDFQQAIRDKVEVPIYLERRTAVIPFLDDSTTERSGLPPSLTNVIHLREVAQDIVSHFETKQERLKGKGLIVVPNRDTALTLYSEITRIKPDWHSDRDTEGILKVVSVADHPSQQSILLWRFQSPDDPLKLAITPGMWLTGIDNPSLYIIYLLRRLSKIELLQSMARVNRVYKGKEYGLVVDYVGIGETLRSALEELQERSPE